MALRNRTLLVAVAIPLVILYLVSTSDLHGLLPDMNRLTSRSNYLAAKLSSWFQAPQGVLMSPTATPFARHIIAVGDLHGDIRNAQRVLQFSGVVDEYGNWSGHADFFVQTGDIIDR